MFTRVGEGSSATRPSLWREALVLAVIAVAYFAAQQVAFLLPATGQLVAAIWPAAGVGLAVLLLNPRRRWPAVAVTLFVVGVVSNLLGHRPFLGSLGFMCVNVSESVTCAWLITAICGSRIRFDRVREVMCLIAAATLVNAGTACLGAGTAVLVSGASFWTFWVTWWSADGLGLLIIAPLIITCWVAHGPRQPVRWQRLLEMGVFLVVWCIVAGVTFSHDLHWQFSYPYMPVVLLIWPALRMGQSVTLVALTLLASITLVLIGGDTVSPWGVEYPQLEMFLTQLYLGCVAASGMLLAASHAETVNAQQAAVDSEKKQRAAADDLRESEQRYHNLFDHANEGLLLMTEDGHLAEVNQAFAEMHGYTVAELVKMDITALDVLAERGLEQRADSVRRMRAGEVVRLEVDHRHKAGHTFPLRVTASLVNLGGRPFFLCFHQDITERQRADEMIAASLHEKEALLKEIHHRVKNNLQIIISLLRLQSHQLDNPVAKAALKDTQSRIRTMALIHEHLYRSENLARVDLAAYLKGLCQQLFHALVANPGDIRLHLDMATVNLGIDQAIPCGLLVNELVSNAIKHAFPEGRTGVLRIELQPVAGGPEWCLRVADNGVGLPSDFDLARLKSLGLSLVPDLARQMGGRLDIGPGPGATFTVTFTPAPT